jgi:hypothetical protein
MISPSQADLGVPRKTSSRKRWRNWSYQEHPERSLPTRLSLEKLKTRYGSA